MSLNESQVPAYVEKLLVPARIALPGPEQITGMFALSASSPFRPGPESLLDLLNAPTRVVPFIRTADDVVLLVSRLAIDWVEVDRTVDPTWVRPASIVAAREEHVHVRMLDGRRIEGYVTMDLPEHLNRISDFLNLPEDFAPLVTRSGIVLMNKARISGARLFESSPKPPGHTAA
jgi:hypothetical protein